MATVRNNRKTKLTRKNNRKSPVSRRNSRKGGYRMYKLWPNNRVRAFIKALTDKGVIADPGLISEQKGLEILAVVANVSVDELKNNINPILFAKVHLSMNENELERGLLKGRSESSFMNQMDELRLELKLANKNAFSKMNFGNVPRERNNTKLN
jgi:hypothetical protein